MATYVNDLRLKEIGTGESSGTWGSETNTNLELIAMLDPTVLPEPITKSSAESSNAI